MYFYLKIWEKFRDTRYNYYNSPEKIFFDASPQGTGKTWDAIIWALNTNKNNIGCYNTHNLIDELYWGITRTNLNHQLEGQHLSSTLFSRFRQLTKDQQRIYGMPEYLCPIPTILINLANNGYMPANYCNEICPNRWNCFYKDHIKEALNLPKIENYNNICLATKSHLHTNIINSYSKFENPILLLDENCFDILYEQKNFRQKTIDIFINLINEKIVGFNNDVDAIWFDIEDILMLIGNMIKGKKQFTVNKKIRIVINRMVEFIDSLGKNPIKKINNWHEEVKKLFWNHKIESNNTNNLFDSILKIFIDIESNDQRFVFRNTIFDEPSFTYSYYINKLDEIKELINKFDKVIFNDATITESIINYLLPEFKDNFKIFRRNDIKSMWDSFFILNRNIPKYGTYPKYSLYNPWAKKGEDPFAKSFYKLAKIMLQVLQKEYKNSRMKVLIIAFKAFIKKLKKIIEQKIPEKWRLDIRWEHWYALEGKNKYSDCDYVILFGCPGKPGRVLKVFTRMFGIPKDILEHFTKEDQMIQGAERLRSRSFPYEKVGYALTTEARGLFNNEINFNGVLELEYQELLDHIKKQGGSTTKDIEIYLNKPNKSVLNTLNKLLDEDLLKLGKKSNGRGRPSWYWYIK